MQRGFFEILAVHKRFAADSLYCLRKFNRSNCRVIAECTAANRSNRLAAALSRNLDRCIGTGILFNDRVIGFDRKDKAVLFDFFSCRRDALGLCRKSSQRLRHQQTPAGHCRCGEQHCGAHHSACDPAVRLLHVFHSDNPPKVKNMRVKIHVHCTFFILYHIFSYYAISKSNKVPDCSGILHCLNLFVILR